VTIHLLAVGAFAQARSNPSDIWKGVIELSDDALSKYVINDLPGTICVLIPSPEGTRAMLLGGKVLKSDGTQAKLQVMPQLLMSSTITREKAGEVSYLSFLSATLDKKEEAKFSVAETSHSFVLDAQIDWVELDKRVLDIRKKYPNLPKGTRFGVVRVASVLMISYQTFFGVSGAGKIMGWGFAGGGRYLSQKGDESHVYKVGVSLTYSPTDLGDVFKEAWTSRSAVDTPAEAAFRSSLDEALTMRFLMDIKGQALSADEQTLADFR